MGRIWRSWRWRCPSSRGERPWYETSALTRDKFGRWARQRINGWRGRLIGEPPWAVGNDPQVRDWARHESMINLAFEGMPVSFLCPDARALPPEIVEYAQSTHPALAAPEGITQSAGYQDPVEFCRRLGAAASGPAGDPLAEVNFGLADLPELRRLVTATAVDAGLEGERAGELAVAMNEVATNAIVHGAGRPRPVARSAALRRGRDPQWGPVCGLAARDRSRREPVTAG